MKPWHVSICTPYPSPIPDILASQWQPLGDYPSRNQAKKALKKAIKQGNVISFVCHKHSVPHS